MKYNAECLFPSLIHIIETDVDEQIKPYCLKAKQTDPVGVVLSNSGGWQSEGNRKDTLITDNLYKVFNKTINNLYQNKLEIINHWININGPKSFNVLHDHPMCDLSGVFYISVPEDSGYIYFQNPHCFTGHAEITSYTMEASKQTQQHMEKFIKPIEGLLLIFPAYLKHGVLPNQSDKDRISVSFNIRIID
jgi:uncharacterized protein (TIGR02466 family)